MRTKLEEYHVALTADFLQHTKVTLKSMTDSNMISLLLAGVAGIIEHLSHGDTDVAMSKKVGVVVKSLCRHCHELCDMSSCVS